MVCVPLSVQDVVRLAREGHVAPHPKWHGRTAHGVDFETAASNPCFCYKVEADKRPGHSDGYVAFTQNWGGEVYRIDFDHDVGADGKEVLLLVTAVKKEVKHEARD